MWDAADVGIVGGGVVGLSIAYELSGRGARVTVLDAGGPEPTASWAGAGMLAPVPTRPQVDVWGQFRAFSLSLHAPWAEALRAETSIDNGYRRCGGLEIATNVEEAEELERRRPSWESEGVAAETLQAADVRRLEPDLSGPIVSAYHFPGRAQVRNPWHLRALREACRLRGVTVRAGCRVEGIESSSGRVASLATAEGRIPCGTAVVAAGPWTAGLLAPLGVEAPTPPLRGQIALLRTARPILRKIVERGREYLVPRGDGRVLIGSTEEWAGFNPTTTASGIVGLLEFARSICPALGEAELERAWAGLRPASRDGAPYIGRVPAFENLYVASGHRRIGVQLSPGTAVLIADLVQGRPPRWDASAFGIDRPPASFSAAFDS